jgi:hypothetical protein
VPRVRAHQWAMREKRNEDYDNATRLFSTPYKLETDSSTATQQIETMF